MSTLSDAELRGFNPTDLNVGEILRVPSAPSPFGDLRYRIIEITDEKISLEIVKDVELV